MGKLEKHCDEGLTEVLAFEAKLKLKQVTDHWTWD